MFQWRIRSCSPLEKAGWRYGVGGLVEFVRGSKFRASCCVREPSESWFAGLPTQLPPWVVLVAIDTPRTVIRASTALAFVRGMCASTRIAIAIKCEHRTGHEDDQKRTHESTNEMHLFLTTVGVGTNRTKAVVTHFSTAGLASLD